MLHVFVKDGGRCAWARDADGARLPPETLWVDLINPTPEEVARAEALMGLPLPTREQIVEIEDSSRLRLLPGGVRMTLLALVFADTDSPRLAPVSFLLGGGRLATVHHLDPQPFLSFRRKTSRDGFAGASADAVLTALIEAIVDRTASVLRRVGMELDTLAGRSFRDRSLPAPGEIRDDNRTLKRLGQAGHLIAKAHESLASVTRMLDFVARGGAGDGTVGKEARRWARGALLDARGLDEYAHFLSGKVKLLLDTILGRINAEQNEIVKIVSVLSVALFPPTLVASILGMNFDVLPGLREPAGYPMALAVMALSAVLPMAFFRRRGWL